MHGIIIINKEEPPVFRAENKICAQSQNLATVVRGYKSGVTIKARGSNTGFRWQPRFHEHIIRDDISYKHIADYIVSNPVRWTKDKFYQDI